MCENASYSSFILTRRQPEVDQRLLNSRKGSEHIASLYGDLIIP